MQVVDESKCIVAMNAHLTHLGLTDTQLNSATRRNLGESTHLFTHIRQRALVESFVLHGDVELDKLRTQMQVITTPATKWVTRDELETAAVSTGMKKAFELLTAAASDKKKLASASASASPARASAQPLIASFFKKKA